MRKHDEPRTEAGRRLLEDFFGDGMILEPLEAILAIEEEAAAQIIDSENAHRPPARMRDNR